jgi:SpoVK/Ycf46/Vps4 family AAA+-type ATPase
MVLATTNCPWDLDTAVLRRFEKRIYVPLPDLEARIEHFQMCLRDLSLPEAKDSGKSAGDEDEATSVFLANITAGYSSADIVLVCREAAMAPMRRLLAENSIADIQKMREEGNLGFTQILRSDFEEAFCKTKPSVPSAMIGRYETWNQTYGTIATL